MPVIPATREAEAGVLLEASLVSKKTRPCLKKKKERKKRKEKEGKKEKRIRILFQLFRIDYQLGL